MGCMTDPANARFGEPHAAREGARLTHSEEDLQSRADTSGYAAPGSEHFGLRWDSSEFDDSRSGSTPTALPGREGSHGHDESLIFGGYSNDEAGGVFGPAPGGSATDVPSYTPDYLTGTAVPVR